MQPAQDLGGLPNTKYLRGLSAGAWLATNPGGPLTNVVFFASDEPLDLSSGFFEEEERAFLVELGEGQVLTDQLNPINFWNAAWAREVRRTRRERY